MQYHEIFQRETPPPSDLSYTPQQEQYALASLATRKNVLLGYQPLILCRQIQSFLACEVDQEKEKVTLETEKKRYRDYILKEVKDRLCKEMSSLTEFKAALKGHAYKKDEEDGRRAAKGIIIKDLKKKVKKDKAVIPLENEEMEEKEEIEAMEDESQLSEILNALQKELSPHEDYYE